MLNLSLEVPTVLLGRFSPLLDLDFVLAHKVLQDSNYAEFFAQRPKGREVILDNSTHEFGTPLALTELQKAVNFIHADWLIAPDIVNEGIDDQQVRQNQMWMEVTASAAERCGVGAVLCGNDEDQVLDYLKSATDHGIGMLCFTFHNRERISQWWKVVEESGVYIDFPRVHILGMHTLGELQRWVEISEEYSNFADFSFDTSKPLKFGVQGLRLDQVENLRGGPVRSKEVLDLTNLSEEQIQCCEANIKWLKAICRGTSLG